MTIELGYGVGLAKDNKVVITTSIDIFDNEGNKIGYCTSISRTDARGVERIRHLDSADAGRVIELQPRPSDVTLAVTGFALYNDGSKRKGLLNRLPGNAAQQFVDLNQQTESFTIKVVETHPATGAITKTYYYGCMLSAYAHPINLTGANVAETATVMVAWIDSK